VSETVLTIDRISKAYPGVQALDDVSMEIRGREVVGLIGENGAGKSTVLKVIAGLQTADTGRILVRGKEMVQGSYRAAADAGIGMVFQEQSLLTNVSVAENILMGHERPVLKFGLYDWKRAYGLASHQLEKIGAEISPSAPTETLSFAERQLVEFAKVLSLEERTHHEPIILLDEPTSVLDAGELEVVLSQVERLRQRASVVFVSHRLEEVLRVSDRVYVMTNGRCLAERNPRHCDVAELQHLMLGRELGLQYNRTRRNLETKTGSSAPPRLVVSELSRTGSFEAVSFTLCAGQVVGIAGVEGSGREAVCRTLFGAEPRTAGEIRLDGELVHFRSPADAVRAGMGYVPADRRTEGIVGGLSVRENMTLTYSKVVQRGPFLDAGREKVLSRKWIDRLGIKTPTVDTIASTLSGGNQQKLVLAKWLIRPDARILILDHPMRGLDVGAKAEIFNLIRGFSESGLGIVLIADTLDELIALSSTIIVMRDGRVSAQFHVGEDSPTKLQILEGMI
jgi:ribose transport system ATP-binding protein